MDLAVRLHEAYQLSLSAYHEVGHLVLAKHYGMQVERLWFEGYCGRIHFPDQRANLLNYSIMLAGGSAAECRLLKKPARWQLGSESDQERIITFGVGDLDGLMTEAAAQVRVHWSKIKEVSELFLKQQVLEKSDIDRLF